MSCFLSALDEVKPAFGVHEEDLQDKMKGGILKYSSKIDNIIQRVQRDIEQTKKSERFNFSSLLLYGPGGSGKTALASFLALQSKFPFIRMISADEMIGMSEPNKVSHIDNTFRDAYRSPLNILIVDDIEAIIDYVPIGPRFSSVVLRALVTRLKSSPPEGKRLIVMSTTSNYTLLKHLDILNCFNDEIPITNLSHLNDLNNVMQMTSFGSDEVRQSVLSKLREVFQTDQISIPVKKVLYNIDTCKFGTDPIEDLVQLMIESNQRV
ncbi:unnamed protein product [Ambrosiozyma monospora]|uniref:Unnamed protein product n=1 Tax=Ambrosiozyma monospora TaxID=43982 RepID=A0ACB5U1L4_AMBMO|nr:unnamed protein product [Ambrosiozyma monospora]